MWGRDNFRAEQSVLKQLCSNLLYAFIVLVKWSSVKMSLSLVTWLWYINPYLLYVFPAVLFITSGKRIRNMILLLHIMSIYDMIMSPKIWE